MSRHGFVLPVLSLSILLVSPARAQLFLPGMQPKEAGIEFGKVRQCMHCHSNTPNGDADIFLSWRGGMMSQAGRDPVYRAALTIANQDIPGVGEFCWRCHTARGWLEGRSTPPDGSALTREDMHGVSCEVCHVQIDPLSSKARKLVKDAPPGYGNGMMVADPSNTVYGPYGDARGPMPHQTAKSDFIASSKLCAVCHNVSHPLAAEDVRNDPPYSFGPIERTYSEWRLSDFARRGAEGSCQSCHFPAVKGGGQASRFGSPRRAHFVQHGPVGGSTWVQDAVAAIWKKGDVDPKALELGKTRTAAFLRTAASLELSFPSAGKGRLRITNLTGHKLPTGYPEGRRMWINLRFLDEAGKTLREIGRYGNKEVTLFGRKRKVPTLLDPENTRVYETKPGLSPKQAEKHGKTPGPSFHFVLNDVIVKDNRIPPQGFENKAFEKHNCEPVGAHYADGQNWDDFDFDLPGNCTKVAVRLLYQSVAWEYIEFLATENRTDDWGKRLYEAWRSTGKCAPSVVAEITEDVR